MRPAAVNEDPAIGAFLALLARDVATGKVSPMPQDLVERARSLLETTDWGVDRIALACGFGSAVTLRQNFVSAYATTPSAYRRSFALREAGGESR